MSINEQELQLACAVLPGLMSRYGQEGYTDSSAIYEAFSLARDCLNEIRKTSDTVESGTMPNTGSPKCYCCGSENVIIECGACKERRVFGTWSKQ